MDIVKNRKAQLEIVALAFLVVGVTASASIGLLGIGGGVTERAEYAKNFLTAASQTDEMETYYAETVDFAARNALEKKGYDLNNFCALGVNADDSLKNEIFNATEELLEKNPTYKEQKLPHMETIDRRRGTLELNVIEGDSALQVEGKPVEPLKAEFGKSEISSGGEFSFTIPTTAELKPDFTVNSLKIKDAKGRGVTIVDANEEVTVVAEFKNIGCAKSSEEAKVVIKAGETKIFEGNIEQLNYGETRQFFATYKPTEAGQVIISASIDENNDVAEIDENNNQAFEVLSVSRPQATAR